MKDKFSLAFKLLTLGYSVIPSGGGDKGKSPLVTWQEWQGKIPDENQLCGWETTLHPVLWGIVTNDHIAVLDADIPKVRAELEATLGKPHVITPRGGGHWYIDTTEHPIKTVAGLLPGVDVRGVGGFVNIVGDKYQILQLPVPGTLIPWEKLPEHVLKALKNDGKSGPKAKDGKPITEPQRNARLTSIAGAMRRQGVDPTAIEAALLEINTRQCRPPLAEREVSTIAASIGKYEPGADQNSQADVALRCLADVQAELVSWLWFPYIPLGKLTLLEGDPGIGKSWVSLAVATGVSLGQGLPGAESQEPQAVVLASAEDGLGDTIRPRLDAMGANVANIHAIDGTLTFDDGGLLMLENFIQMRHPALVILDPLVAYLGATVDLHRANETRAVMAKLADIAEKYRCAILAIRHLTKGGALKPIYRGLGSIDLTAACRSVLLAGSDSNDSQKRGIVQIKSNLAPMGKAIGFELREGVFYWTGESSLTWQRILSAEDSEGKSALENAIEFLKDELADGVLPAKDMCGNAEAIGISKRTLDRAKAQLGVTSRRQGGVWVWELTDQGCQDIPPGGEKQSYGDQGCQDCQVGDLATLPQIESNKEVVMKRLGNVDAPPGIPLNHEAVLGMPVEKALEIWRSEGAPVIHLAPGENCFDLRELLSKPDTPGEHLEVIKTWLASKDQKRGGVSFADICKR
ncbi:MAG: hypothetical protein DDT30_01563 [Dehalococcoidia bacterium]|nr:hypothetical protein [Bacillota bacterium]